MTRPIPIRDDLLESDLGLSLNVDGPHDRAKLVLDHMIVDREPCTQIPPKSIGAIVEAVMHEEPAWTFGQKRQDGKHGDTWKKLSRLSEKRRRLHEDVEFQTCRDRGSRHWYPPEANEHARVNQLAAQ
jgi:hypothetical protein